MGSPTFRWLVALMLTTTSVVVGQYDYDYDYDDGGTDFSRAQKYSGRLVGKFSSHHHQVNTTT